MSARPFPGLWVHKSETLFGRKETVSAAGQRGESLKEALKSKR